MHYRGVDVFEILSAIDDIETIAVEGRIKDIERLRKTYGSGRWRKLKGIAQIRLEDGYEPLPSCIGMRPTASEKRK